MDLPGYLQLLQRRRQLRELDTRPSCSLELPRLSRQEFQQAGQALYCASLQESQLPVVCNLFGTSERLQLLLRCSSMEEFAVRLRGWLHRQPTHPWQLVPHAETELSPWTEIDLERLPAFRSWPLEQQPYLTLALAVTRHPETGELNLGLYRVQVKGKKRLAINFSPASDAGRHLAAAEAAGSGLPVALVLGGDPAWLWAAAAPLPEAIDEFACCAELFGSELRFSDCFSQPLQVPASAELVIEGEIAPGEKCEEGPFGNHSGQYVRRSDCPLMRVTAIASKPQPIIPQTVVGPPPSENIYLGLANQLLLREILQRERPEILDLQMPLHTIFHGASLLSVRAGSESEHLELIEYLQQDSPLKRAKFILLLDEDIDLQRLSHCWWRAINQLQPGRLHQRGTQLLIDATGVDPATLVVDNLADSPEHP